MAIRVFEAATQQQLADLKIPGVVASGDDLGTSGKQSSPITAGLFRIERGEAMPFNYEFDEFKLVLEGEITVTDEAGEVYELKAGDLIQFPAGKKVRFSSNSKGLAFYVAQR